MMILHDAPDIARTLRSGYPEPEPEYELCESCGGEVYSGEELYRWGKKWVCGECLMDLISSEKPHILAIEFGIDQKEVV